MSMSRSERNSWTFWMVAWPIATAAIASGITWWVMQKQRDADLAMRPPVAVMDLGEWVLKSGEGATDEARFLDGARKADEAAHKLQERGLLVLDGRVVRGGPPNVFITTPEVRHAADAAK